MKSIKTHIALIFPLIAILLGLEFFIVFDRTTDSYEKSLKDGYSMMVVAKDEMSIDDFQAWDSHIEQVIEIEKNKILERLEINKEEKDQKKLEASLPNFYSLKLNHYLNIPALDKVKKNLEKSENILKIESFHSSYQSEYELFSFIKFSFWTFIFFMSIIGFFLIIKQMEVWNLLHAERMKVMEIFGASLFLRSQILISMALFDAVISAFITSFIFYLTQNAWIRESQMELLKENVNGVFLFSDIFILLFSSIILMMVAVYIVIINVKEE